TIRQPRDAIIGILARNTRMDRRFVIRLRDEGAMPPNSVADIRQRLRAIPWEEPIRVPFTCTCDNTPLFGCRLCILMFGLRRGERARLFADEAEASAHTTRHAGALSGSPSCSP
ncbi:MAG: hypothetical protein WBG15_21675, partial [Xanthobacteraceae bacterium]